RLALPFLRGEQGAGLRSRGRLRNASEHSGGHGSPVRTGRYERDRRGCTERYAYRLRHQRTGKPKNEMKINRRTYAEHYGPTTGDRVRLGDTNLVVEVESDRTVYGEEVKFGGGKVIRDGMGQSPQATRAAGAPDLVITNCLIVDYTGIYK